MNGYYMPKTPLKGRHPLILYMHPMLLAEWKVLLVTADLPKKKRVQIRVRLRRELKRRGYGYWRLI